MNGQATSILAFKLKKLMLEADKGADVSEAVKDLLAGERKMAGNNSEHISAPPAVLPAVFARLHAI